MAVGSVQKCIYEFVAETESDLSLTPNDLVKITKVINEDWYEGICNGKKGQFPKAFVEQSNEMFDVGIAISSFTTEQEGDLSLTQGEFVVITEAIDTNWLKGYTHGGKKGIFPVTFVQKIDFGEPSGSQNISAGTESNYKDEYIENDTSRWVTVTENFTAQSSNELELVKGMTVEVLEEIDEFWCEGQTKDGVKGMFPRTFVDLPPLEIPSSIDEGIDESDNKSVTEEEDHVNNSSAATEQSIDVAESSTPLYTVIALYHYHSDEPGDLSFNEGDEIIVLSEIDGAWCTGQLGANTGMFPLGYVKIIENSLRVSSIELNNQPDISEQDTNLAEISEQEVGVVEVQKPVINKKKAPGRPKLPPSKKDEPFLYAFYTDSQPTVIIPSKYVKSGCPNVVVFRKNQESQDYKKVNENITSASNSSVVQSSSREIDKGNRNRSTVTNVEIRQNNFGENYPSDNSSKYRQNSKNTYRQNDGSSYTQFVNDANYRHITDRNNYISNTGHDLSNTKTSDNYNKKSIDSHGKFDSLDTTSSYNNYTKEAQNTTNNIKTTAGTYQTKGSNINKEFQSISKNIPDDNASTFQRMKMANNNLNSAVKISNEMGIKTTKTELAKGAVKVGAAGYIAGNSSKSSGKSAPPVKSSQVKGFAGGFRK